ncbi:MAG: EamA-like transporter family protein [Parcubacteria group bacterium ADurb.Bin316]|nr:MAG: EamA-like transporter family protein [Parcubacteria group bacterium ADurb.Bin316]HOZ56527.1 EamA family transporter [bacterium]
MWLFVTIFAYFINAGVYVADKFILSKRIHSSITYAFFVGIWSIFNFVILIFDPWVPTWSELIWDVSAGLIFLFTLVFWYKALHQSEATRVVPIVGALVPIFSCALSFTFLGESLTERQFLAFVILVVGGVLISIKHTKFYAIKMAAERFKIVFGNLLGSIHAEYHPMQRLLVNSTISAFFFAVYYVLIKYIYMSQPFIGSFVWSRLGTFIGVLLILFIPNWRESIIEHQKGQKTPKNLIFFFGVRLLAALAFIMLNWAISLGHVALINSLQGVQYAFLMLMVLFISTRYPSLLEEELGGGVIIQKSLGATLVCVGLYMLAT